MKLPSTPGFLQLVPMTRTKAISPVLRRQRTRTTSPCTQPTAVADEKWRTITVPDRCLRLSQTLHMGQVFRWRQTDTAQPIPIPQPTESPITRQWAGCIGETLYILRQAEPEPPADQPDPVYYMTIPRRDISAEENERVLIDFLRADIDYTSLFEEFREKDAVFDKAFPYFRGVRTIRHDPVECLFSYVCSSNNHMKRTGTMVNHLADQYGTYVASFEGESFNAFPTVETLAENASESDLREAGFGYRAGYVVSTAKALVQVAGNEGMTAEEMLLGWRQLSRKDVEKQLTRFPGIGRKVAGCIALMSLDQLGEIPVDTHVWQMGSRYLPELKDKRLSKKTYDAIGDCFREKFGEDTAGLAHNILFAAELDDFKDVIPGGVPEKLWAGKKASGKQKATMTDSDYLESDKKGNARDVTGSGSTGRKRRRTGNRN